MSANTVPVPAIYAAMVGVMRDVEPIAKDRKNEQQGFKFRGIDDVYAALQVVMAKHGVCSVPTVLEDRTEERTTQRGSALIYRVLRIAYTFYCATDGSSVTATVIGEGMDSGDKAANKAMAVAHKYALLQAFCVPTEEPKDPDAETHVVTPRGGQVISPPAPTLIDGAQRKQLAEAVLKHKHNPEVVGQWLEQRWGIVGGSRNIPAGHFRAILGRLLSDAPLDSELAPPPAN